MSRWLLLTATLGSLVLVAGVGALPGLAAGTVAEIDTTDYAYTPFKSKVAIGDTVTWDFYGPHAHTASDRTDMALFDSGSQEVGGTYSFEFDAAGGYPFHCQIHPTAMWGALKVTMKAKPAKGAVGAPFTITWATAIPDGYVEDLQVRGPSDSGYLPWMTGTTELSAVFTPATAGQYKFQARLRKLADDTHSNWSPARAIRVS